MITILARKSMLDFKVGWLLDKDLKVLRCKLSSVVKALSVQYSTVQYMCAGLERQE